MITLKINDQIRTVEKIKYHEFSDYHHEVLSKIIYKDGSLILADSGWCAVLLGAGEEKAVFGICDHQNRVFALEVIDEKHYLNGRFVGGEYFFDKRINGLKNVKFKPEALLGLTFTGLVRVREFVYGYEWGRFQFDPIKNQWLDHILTYWLKRFLNSKYQQFRKQYKDVHERNLMFEVLEFSSQGIPVIVKDWEGNIKLAKVRLQPIDVR